MMRKILPISFIALILDIISKQLILHFFKTSESLSIIKHFFSLTLAKNTGVAFSMLEGKVPMIILITLIIIFLLLTSLKKNCKNKIEVIGYSLVIGGALGNLLDRIIYGYVIDFLDFNIFGFDFPIFNLADSFIVIGIFLILITNFKEGRNSI